MAKPNNRLRKCLGFKTPHQVFFGSNPPVATSKLNPRSRKIPAHRGRRCEHRMQTEELLRLRWADIDWNAGILTIREAKAGDARRIPMNSTIQGLFSNIQKSSNFAPQDRIFPLDARYLRRVFDKAVNAAGWLLSDFMTVDIALPADWRGRGPMIEP